MGSDGALKMFQINKAFWVWFYTLVYTVNGTETFYTGSDNYSMPMYHTYVSIHTKLSMTVSKKYVLLNINGLNLYFPKLYFVTVFVFFTVHGFVYDKWHSCPPDGQHCSLYKRGGTVL